MTSFELEERDTADARLRLVEVSGELDLTNARELEGRLEELATDERVLALDLNRVLFIDSAALHVLFRAARNVGDGRFGLVLEPSAAIARTLEIVGMAQVVPMFRDPAELTPADAPS